jgi:hypothetical protein
MTYILNNDPHTHRKHILITFLICFYVLAYSFVLFSFQYIGSWLISVLLPAITTENKETRLLNSFVGSSTTTTSNFSRAQQEEELYTLACGSHQTSWWFNFDVEMCKEIIHWGAYSVTLMMLFGVLILLACEERVLCKLITHFRSANYDEDIDQLHHSYNLWPFGFLFPTATDQRTRRVSEGYYIMSSMKHINQFKYKQPRLQRRSNCTSCF